MTHISYIYNIYKICHLGAGHWPTSIAGYFLGKRFRLLFSSFTFFLLFFLIHMVFKLLELLLCNRTAESASTRALNCSFTTTTSRPIRRGRFNGRPPLLGRVLEPPWSVSGGQSQRHNTFMKIIFTTSFIFNSLLFFPKSSTPTTSPKWGI